MSAMGRSSAGWDATWSKSANRGRSRSSAASSASSTRACVVPGKGTGASTTCSGPRSARAARFTPP